MISPGTMASMDETITALEKFAGPGSKPQTLDGLRRELGISESSSFLGNIINKANDPAVIEHRIRSLLEDEGKSVSNDPIFKAWMADKAASATDSSTTQPETATSSPRTPHSAITAVLEEYDENNDAPVLPFGHSNIVSAMDSTRDVKVDNFVEEEATEECFYVPSGLQVSPGPAAQVTEDLANLLTGLEAECATDSDPAIEGLMAKSRDEIDSDPAEIFLVIADEEESDQDDNQQSAGNIVLDESLPSRFRETLAGFMNGSLSVEEEAVRSQNSELECDNTVMEYDFEDRQQ